MVDHLFHPAFAKGHQLRDHAEVFLRRIDGQSLHRLVQLPIDLTGDDLRLTDGEFEPFATHHLHEHCEL